MWRTMICKAHTTKEMQEVIADFSRERKNLTLNSSSLCLWL
jgi:hypothetical protein